MDEGDNAPFLPVFSYIPHDILDNIIAHLYTVCYFFDDVVVRLKYQPETLELYLKSRSSIQHGIEHERKGDHVVSTFLPIVKGQLKSSKSFASSF